ncbi:MAG: CHRD domain-containing protein [Hyphomicrobiaceae bacterium]
MAWAFDASTPTTNTATLIEFNVEGSVIGDTVRINGTGLSYNPTTGVLTGTVESLEYVNIVGVVQTIEIGGGDSGTQAARQTQAAADVTQFLQHSIGTASDIAALGVTFDTFDIANAFETTPGSVITIPVLDGGLIVGYLQLTGDQLYADKPFASGDIYSVEMLTSTGVSYGTPKTIDYSSSSPSVTFAELTYGQGANFDLLFAALTSGDDAVTVQQAGATIDAGLGNDVITGSGFDTVDYQYATGKVTLDLSNNSATFIDPRTGDTYHQTLTGVANVNGSMFSDILLGDSNNNVLFGGFDGVNDSLNGGAGDDTYIVIEAAGTAGVSDAISDTSGNDTIISYANRDLGITTTIENLTLMGSATDGKGNNLDNVLTGNDLNNSLDGKVGADTVIGGLGDDTYTVDDTGDVVVEFAGEGNDTVLVSKGSFALSGSESIENLRTTSDIGVASINLTGSTAVNTITGNNGANRLDGGSNGDDGVVDTLNGLDGSDTYVLGAGHDIVNDTGGVRDTIESSISRNLADYSGIEDLVLTGTGDADATGNGANNKLFGNDGANVITGGAGNDTMTGGAGDDVFVFDGLGRDIVTDFGNTYVRASLTEAGVVTPSGSTATGDAELRINLAQNRVFIKIDSTGLDWNSANSNNNTVTGFGVYEGADNVNGTLSHDVLTSANAKDKPGFTSKVDVWNTGNGLTAGDVAALVAGDKYLEVATTQYNSPGDIRGQLAAAAGSADKISVAGLGISSFETIQTIARNGGSSVMLQKWTNDSFNIMTLQNTQLSDLSASNFIFDTTVSNDTINGTAGRDDLYGGLGNDALNGGNSVDRLFGEDGNDVLNGGAAGDQMYGGAGNDTYYVDSAGDYVVDTTGVDTIRTSINNTLNMVSRANIENLETANASGTTALTLVGNALDNTITGNAGANVLNGWTGNDTMIGGAGNDIYYVDSQADVIVDTSGTDTVRATVNYTLANNLAIEVLQAGTPNIAMNLFGNNLGQRVQGNGKDNVIGGKFGNDTLVGGQGKDSFLFDTSLNANTNKDVILDFNPTDDTIRLDHSVFSQIATGTLQASTFYVGTAAHDANDRIIYNRTTGELTYDANGNAAGGAVVFAVINNKANLTANDFFVI